MPADLVEVIDDASFDDRTILAALLETSQNDSQSLRDRLRSKSRNLWHKVSGNEVSYTELLNKIGAAHGIRPVLFETPADFERRVVRTFFRRTQKELAAPQYGDSLLEMKKRFRRDPRFGPEAAAGASIIAAQASGFGVYQMATTVVGMASSAASITIPFIGYMALTKAIFFAIGPLGWAALGTSTLHKLTKPKYSEMVAIVAWMFLVRNQAYPQRTFGNYSVSELLRKFVKTALPVGLAIALFIAVYASSSQVATGRQGEKQPNPFSPVAASSQRRQAEQQSGRSTATERSGVVGQVGDGSDGESNEIAATLTRWASAQAQNDAAKTAGFYAEQVDRYFLQRNVTREFVQADKQALLDKGTRLNNFSISNLRIQNNSPQAATIFLTKSWAILDVSGTVSTQGSTRSRLWLERGADSWKIIGEQDLK